jgi:hypothetical protein
VRIERCNSWCVIDKGVCKFCGWPDKEKSMPDKPTVVAVTDAMLMAGVEAFTNYQSEDEHGLVLHVYQTMRVLEPPAVSALTIYDVSLDKRRPVTALDLDLMQAGLNAYGALVRSVEQARAQLAVQVKLIRSQAGAPHEGDVA